MFGKRMRFLLILMASIVMPYFWFNDYWAKSAKSTWDSFFGTSGNRASASSTILEPPKAQEGPPTGKGSPQVSSGPEEDLAAVLRFDVSPEWVTQRWPRVSTVLAEQELEGLRVPLVTGTQIDDLTGSLTYYFDRQRRVQRIAFQGHTGDERKLMSIVTNQFGMRAEPTLGAGIYVARWNARPMSVVRIAYASVVRSQSPHNRLQVALEINRPNTYYGLSQEFQRLLLQDRQTWRW